MTKKKSAKRAFISSFMSFIMCFAMLAGTTFAWYTDSVTSSGNKIIAGTLDIQLWKYDGNNYVDISASTAPIFQSANLAQNNTETLWEPGKTQVAYLKLVNNGNLALKYQVALKVYNISKKLNEVMQYTIVPDAEPAEHAVSNWASVSAGATTTEAGTQTVSAAVPMDVGATHCFALVIHMDENAGNEYMGGEVDFDLTILATQYTQEADSFGITYDALADGTPDNPNWPYIDSTTVEATSDEDGALTFTASATPDVEATMPTVVEFPEGALDGSSNYSLTVDTEDVPPASLFSVREDEGTVATIDLTLLKDNVEVGATGFNAKTVTITTYIAKGLDSSKISVVYINDNGEEDTEAAPTLVSYDPATGKLIFTTTHFSEYRVVSKEVVAYNIETGDFYTSMDSAVAQDGSVIILKNYAEEDGITVEADKKVTIDLNGYTISGNTDSAATYALITNKGDLTIKDGTDKNKDGTGTGLLTTFITNPDGRDVPGYASNTVTNHGTLTVESGKIVNNGTGYACYAIDNVTNSTLYTPVLIINGGRMQQMNAYTYAVRMFCNSTTNNNGVTVNGGIIEGGYSFWLQTPNGNANKASLEINGGTFIARDGYAIYFGGSGSTVDTRNYSNTSIIINGGNLNRVAVSGVSDPARSPAMFQINGGSITEFAMGNNVSPTLGENVELPN
ncbi:MAG: hypothetical protein IJU94_01595 [Clostridia bacterium]|nr:hypothetical protein [Clostridia bacterium]